MQENLHTFGHIRILVGINLDSYSQQLKIAEKAKVADADKNRLLKIFKSQQIEHIDADGYKRILNDASVETGYQALEILKRLLSDGILQMRVVRDGNVHAKFYIFSKYIQEDKSYRGSLFVGSSNLTDRGWVKQYEFNAELRDSADIETALYEFSELWKESVEITTEHIEEIKARSHLTHRTPEEIYYKLLIEYFGIEAINATDPKIAHLFPEGYDALEYQMDAIRDGANMLERFGGFFLSDVVGLGKTLTISVLLKYLEMTDKLRGNILIILEIWSCRWILHLQDIISANFDPKCEESKKKDDYHILITTDTLSEGVNMHRACHLIHYDAPWNATQMMQRAGRINRIGGEHKQIFTYSFHSAKDIDDILKLCAQVFAKLQSFHYTLGEDSQVFDSGEEVTASGISSKCEEGQEEPEENPRLLYLDDIRMLAKDDPAKFKRIAKIPLKSRSNIIGDTTETYAFFKQKRNKKHGGRGV